MRYCYNLLAKMSSLTCMLMFVSQIILLVFTETLFMAGAKLPLSVLVRIFLSKGVNVWLRLQVKNVVCTEVIPTSMAFV